MAKPRRRSARNTLKTAEETEDTTELGIPASANIGTSDDKCPACQDEGGQNPNSADRESWVRCDACKSWFHWRCVGQQGDLETVDKWYCQPCLRKDITRSISHKPPIRKSSRKRITRDFVDQHTGTEPSANKWLKMLEGKPILEESFKRMKGEDVCLAWLERDPHAMEEPIIIETPEGLGIKMPPEELSIADISETLGEATPVEVIDVATQSNSPGWTIGKWANYFSTEPASRDKVRNVISLEISGTALGDKVVPPKFVRDLDWVENHWPHSKKGKGNLWPKVQLYCLMGVSGAWTDWHIDFAGSSVYYHILWGRKTFFFARPTPENLAAYEKWSGSEIQTTTWLGDLVDKVYKVDLVQGNTMIIPTGWIHAVYTPVDTLVFGGNFLHSLNVVTQMQVKDIEIATHVPKKFRFPLFTKLCWYVGESYLRDLKAREELSPRVLESILSLADFLVSESRIIERGSEAAKKESKENVPGEKVKDAPAVARELRWRIKHALGYASDTEGGHTHDDRCRGMIRTPVEVFRNFVPKKWDRVVDEDAGEEVTKVRALRPDSLDEWVTTWTAGWPDDGAGEAEVLKQRKVLFRVRKTESGIERQRIERTIEDWSWLD